MRIHGPTLTDARASRKEPFGLLHFPSRLGGKGSLGLIVCRGYSAGRKWPRRAQRGDPVDGNGGKYPRSITPSGFAHRTNGCSKKVLILILNRNIMGDIA